MGLEHYMNKATFLLATTCLGAAALAARVPLGVEDSSAREALPTEVSVASFVPSTAGADLRSGPIDTSDAGSGSLLAGLGFPVATGSMTSPAVGNLIGGFRDPITGQLPPNGEYEPPAPNPTPSVDPPTAAPLPPAVFAGLALAGLAGFRNWRQNRA